MNQITLKAKPLTQDTFAPYGDVVEIKDAFHFSINEGTIERFHDLADINVGGDPDAKVITSIAKCNSSVTLPYKIDIVERHPLGTQLFFPMFTGPMIVVVGQHGEEPDPFALEAFVSNGQQGINFHRNTWHIPLISLNEEECYLIVDRAGPGNNCIQFYFDESISITLQPLA